MFEQFLFQGRKVIMVFIGSLTIPRCLKYHDMYTKFAITTTFFSTKEKILRYFRRKLSNLWCIYYRAIYTKFIEGMFSTFFPMVKVIAVCVCKLLGMRLVYYHVVFT